MDPLSVLRDFAMRGEHAVITRAGEELRFADQYSFPSSAVTGYRSKQGGFYTLDALVFFVQNHHLKHTDYLQAARLQRLPTVTLPDRKPLLDYLLGRTSSSDAVVLPPLSSSAPSAIAADEYRPEEFSLPHSDPGGVDPHHAIASADAPDGAIAAGVDPRAFDTKSDAAPFDFLVKIRELERPLKDRSSLLVVRNRDFHAVLVASVKREEERHRLEMQQRKDGLVAKMRVGGADDHHRHHGADDGIEPLAKQPKLQLYKGRKIGEGVPIILVPSAFQTKITIFNVKEFLEDGVFVPSDVKAKTMKGPKPDCVTVQKKLSRDRTVAAYEVRDKSSAFKPEDWDRVVAVFVLGKEWQFKDWPFKDHVEIFNKILGFYVRFEDDSLESAKVVKQWNVKIITISKNKRHQDRTAALEVWDRIEEFVRSRSHQ